MRARVLRVAQRRQHEARTRLRSQTQERLTRYTQERVNQSSALRER